MNEEITIAGSGGQGVLTLGVMLAQIGTFEGKNVTWLPSYGAEKRGGFSFCDVIISESEIYSPVVDMPGSLILFDRRASDIYLPKAGEKTFVFENSSLVPEKNIKCAGRVRVPASEMARKMRFMRSMNIVMAGCYLAKKGIFKKESAYKVMGKMLKNKPDDMLEKNIYAFDSGVEFVKNEGLKAGNEK